MMNFTHFEFLCYIVHQKFRIPCWLIVCWILLIMTNFHLNLCWMLITDLTSLLSPIGLQNWCSSDLKKWSSKLRNFNEKIPKDENDLRTIHGIGQNISLLTLQYAFRKEWVSSVCCCLFPNYFWLTVNLIFNVSGHSSWYSC